MISVIVPIYNVEKYLDRCLSSIAGQTYTNFEVFLIDDGSTDGSAAIALQYVQDDPRFRYIYQENQGLSVTRNNGMDLAEGQYISFIDSDDYISDDYFEGQMTVALKGNFDIVGSHVQKHRRGKLSSLWKYPEDVPYIFINPKTINKLESWAHSRLFKKSMIDRLKIRFIKGVIYEDIPFTWEVLISTGKIGFTQKGYYAYNRDNGQAITRNILDRSMDLITVLDQTRQWLKEHGYWQDYQYVWLQKALSITFPSFRYMSNKEKFIEQFQQSLQNDQFPNAQQHLLAFEYKMYYYLIDNNSQLFYSYYNQEKIKSKIFRKFK